MKRNITTISIKKDGDYKKFIEICEKIGIKKSDVLKALIKEFNKDPKKIINKMI